MEGSPVPCSRPASLKVTLRCDLTEVRSAVAAVHGFLVEQGWSEVELLPLDLALVEACNNACRYAVGRGRTKPVEVDAHTDDTRVEFRIHDSTPGFEWPRIIELPPPDRETGRGLYLITSLTDYAAYFRGQHGNILLLRKARAKPVRVPLNSSAETPPEPSPKVMENERAVRELVEEQVHRRLVMHELEIANGIQRSLLPETLPQLPGIGIAGFCRSAREVGGDFYDVLQVNENSLLLVIADVMGKGIPAAMFAVILRSLLRASPELTHRPAALLTRVNRLLYPELSGVDMFITAQLAYVEVRERRMLVASAGHCPLAVAHAGDVSLHSPEGMPLGILPDATFLDETVRLPEKSRALLFTDGLSDALNAKRESFGQDRVINWLRRTTVPGRTADELKSELVKTLDAHQLNTGLYDDQTFLILAG